MGNNIQGLPSTSYVSRVLASTKGRGTCYVTFDRHREGDWNPYIYKTDDYGQTWEKLHQGLPSGSVNVIIEHPDNSDVLFVGTENSVFVSVNSGEKWAKVSGNLPTTLYDDMLIHPRDKDLVLGTHGRSFWILDDTSPFAEWHQSKDNNVHLFSIRPATLFYYWKDTSYRGQEEWAGPNPPYGALINFVINNEADSARVSISRNKKIVREYNIAVNKGKLDQIVWNLKYAPPSFEKNEKKSEGLTKPDRSQLLPIPAHNLDPKGPDVSPGTYLVTIYAGDDSYSQKVKIYGDPKLDIKAGNYRQREEFLLKLHAFHEKVYSENKKIKKNVKESEKTMNKDDEKLKSMKAEQKKVNTIRSGAMRLASELQGGGIRQGSFYPPTKTHLKRYDQLVGLWEEYQESNE